MGGVSGRCECEEEWVGEWEVEGVRAGWRSEEREGGSGVREVCEGSGGECDELLDGVRG